MLYPLQTRAMQLMMQLITFALTGACKYCTFPSDMDMNLYTLQISHAH